MMTCLTVKLCVSRMQNEADSRLCSWHDAIPDCGCQILQLIHSFESNKYMICISQLLNDRYVSETSPKRSS